MRKRKSHELLTEVELEFMTELWKIGEGSVRDILACLPAERKLAYTSCATIMRILDDKGFVDSRKEGKTLIYAPRLSKDTYQSRSLRNLSDKLFDGTPASLVARLVDDYDLSENDLEEIRALLDRRRTDDAT
ncbi:BlaI/MecI/CopY family transcriptional regulator [Labrenzia sp. PHM005]|uniref:BlaI/MecI/CopY family transcriptional regulator n=1 Tax=Stappiaceae TaxID=2821832 RepID=UPI001140396B|nr:BlaI/MecI/CopY family transcriptional regulator [Labrenzia sp. PHM005]QDG76598.1 BlaI/MecI/CopY family transcriptional regulator [Labrenzia sp. PHM005]